MALNGSGPISLGGATAGQSIALELGLSTTGTISLNQSDVRTLANVASGTIIMPTNFWGKANAFMFTPTISANTQNYNLRSAAIAAGWDQVKVLKATVTINSGVYVGASNTSNTAFTWTGSYPSGSTLAIINNGVIEGAGGNGGTGATPEGSGGSGSGGGTALVGNYAMSITNNNVVAGGGGGGGGGGGAAYSSGKRSGGSGGGGGGAGYAVGAGGSGGGGLNGGGSGGTGNPGTITGTGGSGGGGGSGQESSKNGLSGGAGGNWGANGSAGAANYPAGGGGAGGKCTATGTNAYITWVATGSRYGTLG